MPPPTRCRSRSCCSRPDAGGCHRRRPRLGSHRPARDVATPLTARTPSASRVVRLVLAYDGTGYAGWQWQPDAVTVQGLLVDAARAVLGTATRVTGASRTDAGVHALRQVVSMVTEATLAPAGVMGALNARLPRDVRILAAAEAPPGFDARRAAVGKRYAYLIDNAAVPSPLLMRYAWHVARRLDVAAMRRAATALRGCHDFSAFCAAPGRSASPVCAVRSLHVLRRRDRVAVLVSADRFLHHMVRNFVGSLVAVGRGTREPGWVAAVLAGRDRTRAGVTAPAHGLALIRVTYRDPERQRPP